MVMFNGEIIAGCALIIMGVTFIGASMVNSTWGAILLVDFIIVSCGGCYTWSWHMDNKI